MIDKLVKKNGIYYSKSWSSAWKYHWHSFYQFELQKWKQILESRPSLGLTRKRVKRVAKAKIEQLHNFQKILGHKKTAAIPSSHPQYFWDSHLDLFLRDWCWKESENKLFFDYLGPRIPKKGKVLLLGAGACGLLDQLAKAYPEVEFHGLDQNALFLHLYQSTLENKINSIWEFPYSPIDHEHACFQWQLQQINLTAKKNLKLFCMPFDDFLKLNQDKYQLIISPWFFDILESPIDDTIKRLNPHLEQDASLCYLGPQSSHQPAYQQQFCQEEIIESFANAALKITQKESFKSTYLKSPFDANQRIESLLFIHGLKEKHIALASSTSNKKELEMIPLANDFYQWKEKQMKLISYLLQQVDGKKSYQEIAAQLAHEYGEKEDFFRQAVLQVFQQLDKENPQS